MDTTQNRKIEELPSVGVGEGARSFRALWTRPSQRLRGFTDPEALPPP